MGRKRRAERAPEFIGSATIAEIGKEIPNALNSKPHVPPFAPHTSIRFLARYLFVQEDCPCEPTGKCHHEVTKACENFTFFESFFCDFVANDGSSGCLCMVGGKYGPDEE